MRKLLAILLAALAIAWMSNSLMSQMAYERTVANQRIALAKVAVQLHDLAVARNDPSLEAPSYDELAARGEEKGRRELQATLAQQQAGPMQFGAGVAGALGSIVGTVSGRFSHPLAQFVTALFLLFIAVNMGLADTRGPRH